MIFLELTLWILGLSLFSEIYRIYKGPTAWDRLLASNNISIKGLMGMALYAKIHDISFLYDVALVYGVIGYVGVTLIANFLSQGGRLK